MRPDIGVFSFNSFSCGSTMTERHRSCQKQRQCHCVSRRSKNLPFSPFCSCIVMHSTTQSPLRRRKGGMRGARGKRNVMAARKKQREEKETQRNTRKCKETCRSRKAPCEGPCSWRRAKRSTRRASSLRANPSRCTLPPPSPSGLPAAAAPSSGGDTALPAPLFKV
jgi:hypothetical protein